MILVYSALGYHLATIITRFMSHSVAINVSMKQEQQLNFPAVSICNMNPIRRSAWENLRVLTDVTDAPEDPEISLKRKKRGIGTDTKQQFVLRPPINALQRSLYICN